METTNDNQEGPSRLPNGRLTFYHAKSNGAGSAIQLELRLNKNRHERYNCFFLEMARQKTAVLRREEVRAPATFDWSSKVTVKMNFMDICEFLTVLEGKQDHVGGQHNGIYHEAGNANTLIAFRKNADHGGYHLGVSKKDKQGNQIFRGNIALSKAEAIGLKSVFQTGLFYMAFHENIRPEAS